jgi:hypothetical protein
MPEKEVKRIQKAIL